jgi:hypothetical protein
VSLDLFKLGIFISCTFAGNLGEVNPAFCMSFHAIKQFDDKWETTKLLKIMVLDVPVSGSAVQWWYSPSSVALK